MNLTYRCAEHSDAEVIFSFCKELIDKYENISEIDYDKVILWVRKKIFDSISEYQCIFLNGKKVGYFHFSPVNGMMELDDLYIFREYQNKGIGTKVIEKCINESNLPIFLFVFIKNRRAIDLYKRIGFEITERIRNSRYIMYYDKNNRKKAQ